MTSEPEMRLAVINAVLADVATKHDIHQLKEEVNTLRQHVDDGITQLRQEMGTLRQHIDGETGQLGQEMNTLRQHIDDAVSQLREEMGTLRQHVDGEISQLRQEMNQLRRDINTNFRWTVGLIIAVWGTTVLPLLMKIAGLI